MERADIFTDRPSFPMSERLSEGKGTEWVKTAAFTTIVTQSQQLILISFVSIGLFMTSGHMWRQQRRFALSTLKYFGVGKKTLQNAILQECRFLCDTIRTERGQ